MMQQKLKLSTDLAQILSACDEIWIAVALISDNGFKFIQDHINPKAKQNYLVGIGLPTSPKVLTVLKANEGNGNFSSKIYHKPNEFFHPKVYLIKKNGQLTAWVGSGNCTTGGLDKNLELSIKVVDQDFCNGLVKWFNTLFKFGHYITDDFLHSYSLIYSNRIRRIVQDNAEVNAIIPDINSKLNLNTIDFTNQFFKKEHYAAFVGTKPWNMSDAVNQERINVRNRLFKLHSKLYPKIRALKWDLHEHYVFDDTVSSAIHGQFTSTELGGIWLHYGRDKKDIKAFGEKETPLDFMRLQVIIHKDNVGIWNRVGKDFGSKIDRDYFKSRMSNDASYRRKFYSIIAKLPNEYFVKVNQDIRYVREFASEQELTSYVLADDLKYYFIIGIEFPPDDVRISDYNIINTITNNFGLLYPTYELMKYNLTM